MGVCNFLWKLPIRILKYGLPLLIVQEPPPATGTMPRRRPLYTCGSSLIATIHQTCKKVQDCDGSLGTMSKRTITVLNPFFPIVYGVLHHWLAVLSFIDDIFLISESMFETMFPPSKQLFDKIDSLVCSAEALPEHVDDLFRNFPTIIQKFPLLDWILLRLISWSNFLHSALKWGLKNNAREKEITIDVNCSDTQSCRSAFEDQTTDCPIKSLSIDQAHPSNKMTYEENSNPDPSIHVHVKDHHHQNDKMDHIEPSNETSSDEVVLKSVNKLVAVRKGMNALLEEPYYSADSPGHYYESADSSPLSDSAQDEIKSINQTTKLDASSGCTYKEVLKKGTKEDEEVGEDNDSLQREVHEVPCNLGEVQIV